MPLDPLESETEPKSKRSQTRREFKALEELVRILKPFNPQDRKRLLDTAHFMLGSE